MDIDGCFHNALDWSVTQERQAILADPALMEEVRLGDLALSSEADETNWHLLLLKDNGK